MSITEKKQITYTVIRKNVKNLNLRIRHDGSVVVSAPLKAKDDFIEKFIYSKREWIIKHSEKILPSSGCFFYLGESVPLTALEIPLKDYYEKQSKLVLTDRFNTICDSLNLHPNLITKPLKGKYGYYEKKSDTVCLNAALIAVPATCIDYVIIHELMHTKHLNHGKGFHQLVDSLVPNNRQLRELLSKYVIFNLFD